MTQAYRPDPALLALGPRFWDPVEPARFPQAIERFFNADHAARLGLGALDAAERAAHFHRFEPLPGNLPEPLALRYHGHQFRHYNPDLGDGRGFSFAQLRDGDGRLREFGTKGSGTTPWSRSGDGRLTLKGAVREVLASEMLEALGVPTSNSLAVYETGEALVRGDEPSPTRSAVLTRSSHGHVRIGSFQRLAYLEDRDALAVLTRYALVQLYDDVAPDAPAAAALRLFDRVADRTARLAAHYIAAGFVHGVLNSDNINITGESFDYGPWRFTPWWDEDFTAAYFDHGGLYAFGRQPEAIHWNLAQLGGCLMLLEPDAAAMAAVNADWPARFEAALTATMLERLGVGHGADPAADKALLGALLGALRSRAMPIDALFHACRGGRLPDPLPPALAPLAALLADRDRPAARAHPYWSDPEPCSMGLDAVEAIWAAIDRDDDWQPFEAKLAAIRRMGAAHRAGAAPPAS